MCFFSRCLYLLTINLNICFDWFLNVVCALKLCLFIMLKPQTQFLNLMWNFDQVGNLCAPVEEWIVGGTALTSLMDVERRHGTHFDLWELCFASMVIYWISGKTDIHSYTLLFCYCNWQLNKLEIFILCIFWTINIYIFLCCSAVYDMKFPLQVNSSLWSRRQWWSLKVNS